MTTAASSATLYNGSVGDFCTSADGLTAYVAGTDGVLRSFNAETGALIQSWSIGLPLGGIAISPDGSFLMVTGHPESQYDLETPVVAYHVDLSTDAVTGFPYPSRGFDAMFEDVAILADGRAYFAQPYVGAIWALDLSTGVYERATDSVYYQPSLTTDRSGERLLIAENSLTSEVQYVFMPGLGVVGQHMSYDDGVSGPTGGFQAMNSEAGFIAQYAGGALHVYDASLGYLRNLSSTLPFTKYIGGFNFDESGEFLYIVDTVAGAIVQVSTTTWAQVNAFDLPDGAKYPNLVAGEELIVGPDAAYFLVNTHGRLLRVDNPLVADSLVGTDGNDVITGTAGDDVLIGLAGLDRTQGGAGNDRHHVDRTGDVVSEAAGGGIDTVVASTHYALSATAEVEVLRTSNARGTAFINLAGNGYADTITGNAGANRLQGLGRDDVLHGLAGNDVLDGGLGTDRMDGGDGNDTYVADERRDAIIEAIDGGLDTVKASTTFFLGANVEQLMLTGTEGISGFGNALGNSLIGNSASNRLNGGKGADVMRGGAGDDVYDVDNLGDRVIEVADGGFESVTATVDFRLGAHVEDLVLAGAAVSGWGNSLDNRILGSDVDSLLWGFGGTDSLDGGSGDDRADGGAGDDYLHGGEGNDLLIGGAGADELDGGAGDDRFVVDDLHDRVFERADEGSDLVTASVSFTLTASASVERMAAAGSAGINLTGNALENEIIGNAAANILNGAGGNDRLVGGAGGDTLLGGLGDDRLDGGAGIDAMRGEAGHDIYVVSEGDRIVELAGGGRDAVLAGFSYRLANEVEGLTLTGTGNFAGTGNAADNSLNGNGGANTLKGMAGNDLLRGGLGNDLLMGNAGADVLAGQGGADHFWFTAGDTGVTEAAADHIVDFQRGLDKVVLTSMDADTTAAGNSAFRFIGAGAFTGDAGELRFEAIAGGGVRVEGDLNGDSLADFALYVDRLTTVTSSDFLL